MNNAQLVNLDSGKTDWRTPKDFFAKLDAEFHFTLDPCSTHENALCEKHYTEEENGLVQEWGGGDCFYESSLLPPNRRVDRKGLPRIIERRLRCLPDPGQTGRKLLA